jgi:hypothetical protein
MGELARICAYSEVNFLGRSSAIGRGLQKRSSRASKREGKPPCARRALPRESKIVHNRVHFDLTLLEDVRAAGTLESGYRPVGLQPTRQSIGLNRCHAPSEFSFVAKCRPRPRSARRCHAQGIGERRRPVRDYADQPGRCAG